MFPKLFEIPLFGNLPMSWPVFLAVVAGVAALATFGSKVAEQSRLLGRLLTILPVAGAVTAFVTFVETPFGKIPINSYGFSIMVGFLLASWIAVRRGAALGLKSDFILDVGIIGMIFGIVGAKINYLLQYGKDIVEEGKRSLWGDPGMHPLGALLLGPIPLAFWYWRTHKSGRPVRLASWQNGVLLVLTLVFSVLGARAFFLWQHQDEYSWKLFRNWQSGFVLYGGLLAGVAAASLYVKMRGVSLAAVADLSAAPMMLGVAFGRLGCFLNGCCYGKAGGGFPALRFPPDSPVARDQKKFGEWSDPVHPTQLYESLATLAFFFFLSWLYRRRRKTPGEVFLTMGILYGSWRFLVEFARGDERPHWIGTLTYSQVVSLAAVLVCGVWLYLRRQIVRPPGLPQPAATPEPGQGAPASEGLPSAPTS